MMLSVVLDESFLLVLAISTPLEDARVCSKMGTPRGKLKVAALSQRVSSLPHLVIVLSVMHERALTHIES
jgi:hypothetical protein